jgi:CheY-like chemotaxis protein/putative methionine-R-sulfoxide reductase with GAF domain
MEGGYEMSDMRSRVLIVDDELFFREAIGEILTEAGFQTGLAEDGRSALALADAPDFGAVVLDVRLPDLDGIQVLASIREMRPELPVIMLSSSTDQEIVLEALRLGANDYLAKPLHAEELVLAVGRALEGHEICAERNRLQGRIDRLVAGMERLSQLVRHADPGERLSVLRQGIVDSTSDVLEASRVSLMLADSGQEFLSVVAARGVNVEIESMSPRKIGEGASGLCFSEGNVLCVADAEADERFARRAPGAYERPAFAMVPLVCLGVPVGVLCVTHGQDDRDLFLEEPNVLRLLGMQISEFLAADPEVEQILASAAVMDVEGIDPLGAAPLDGDAELARLVCEAVAAETEPQRMLERALSAVSRQLSAAPVSIFLLSPDEAVLELEAEVDGGAVGDRTSIPATKGLAGTSCQSGQLVAVEEPAEDVRFVAEIDTASDGVVRPYIVVPLRLRDKVVGLLRVFGEPDSAASPRTAEILAAAFSAALRNVLLYRSLLQSVEEVAQARREARS